MTDPNSEPLLDDADLDEEGISEVGEFIGWWFIRKAMWASKSSIKSNATSLTKFYTFLVEKGLVKAEELADLKQQVKAELPEWLEALERYDDPDVELDATAWRKPGGTSFSPIAALRPVH